MTLGAAVISVATLAFFGNADAIWIYRPPYRPPPPPYRPPPPPTTTPAFAPPVTLPAFEPGFSCQGQPDGVYGLGCSEEFVTCRGGQPTYHRCPGNLVYDTDSGRCIGRAYALVCGGTPTLPTAAAPPETTTYFVPETSSRRPRRHRGRKLKINVKLVCKGLPSGIYGRGCSSNYVYCSEGRPSWHHCPAPLKFDPVTFKCISVEKIPSCHGGYHPIRPHFDIGEAYRNDNSGDSDSDEWW